MRKRIFVMITAGVLSVLAAGCGAAGEAPEGGNAPSGAEQTQMPAEGEGQKTAESEGRETAESEGQKAVESKSREAAEGEDQAGVAEKVDTAQGGSRGNGLISEEKAKKIALQDADVSEKDASRLRIHLETDDGIQKYEVEFHVGRQEYDYEIDAESGNILERDKESAYD